jgi:site-specific DNA-methyltransferase (adenine-specific)
MIVNIEDAGFEIRYQIMGVYGSGFPKSHNIGKAVDKLQGNERIEWIDNNKTMANIKSGNLLHSASGKIPPREPVKHSKGTSPYEGWGTALKPANEPICVARKPLSEKSVAENVLKWGTGGINVDGCRVGSETHIVRGTNISGKIGEDQFNRVGDERNFEGMNKEVEGRFPANIILECICDEVIKGEKGEVKRSVSRDRTKHHYNSVGNFGSKEGAILAPDNYNDKGDIHTNPMCPCYLMDQQSGVSKSNTKSGKIEGKSGGLMDKFNQREGTGWKDKTYVGNYSDKGGASRFFYQAKVSKAERNMGLDGFEEKKKDFETTTRTNKETADKFGCERKGTAKNTHPTLKPINLMTYLCRLVTPPNGIVLDPFMGSGSTGIAAQLEGFRFVGMEMDADYFKIAEARIESYEKYKKFKK